jgi:hypothetical protein
MVTNHSAEDDAHSSIMAYDCHINMASHDYWRWVNIKGIVGLCHLTSIQSILIGLYTVSNHGVVTSDVHQRTGMIQRATTTRSLGRQHEVTTSTIGFVNYRHKAGVDGQLVVLSTSTTSHVLGLPYLLRSTGTSHALRLPYLLFSTGTSHALCLPYLLSSTGTSHALCLPYLLSTSTSHVLLGSPYLLDTRRSCTHVVGHEWDQYSHVLTACEVDWGPPIIIDGELSLSRNYSKNSLASNGECPISGDDERVLGTTERKFIGTTMHHVDDSDAIVALTNPRVVSDYFDHYYTTAQCNDHDARMLPVTVHHELRPPAEPPPVRMDFISSQNDDECRTYNVLNTSSLWYFERANSKQVSTFTRLDPPMTMNVTTSSSVKIVYAQVDLSNFIDGARRCKSVIGPFQWAMIMGRIDATTAMMVPSVFLVVQLDYVTSVVVSFYQFKFVKIRFKFREPDYSNLMVHYRDWAHSTIDDGASMRTSRDDTVLLVTLVAITSYVKGCVPHDPLVMGRSSTTGILHLELVTDYNRAFSVDDDAPSRSLVK